MEHLCQSVRTFVRKKSLDHYHHRHICLMNHQNTYQTNPMAQRDPLDVPLHPLGPLNRSIGLIELLQ